MLAGIAESVKCAAVNHVDMVYFYTWVLSFIRCGFLELK
jgi:hypothetical protein